MVNSIKKSFFTILVLLLLTGCATPFTKGVVNDIGIDDINRFQYYSSAAITLTATQKTRDPNIDKKGIGRITISSYRDKIIISKRTKGVLMDLREDDNGLLILDICFEEKATDGDKILTFRQDGPGLEQNFYLVYSDPRRRIIQYGDREYSLETRSGERVHLKIKVNRSEIERERVRRVKGRKVEN